MLPALQEAGERLFGMLPPYQGEQFPAMLRPLRDSAAQQLGIEPTRLKAASVNGAGGPV